ncbi:hypothetical protein SMRU11_00745 (plasmid) [Sinorhizobium meliloti RU11/001]|nr:hypothetical protein SMRU11_00745 [Sinorhizobium meliloti RU11/001]
MASDTLALLIDGDNASPSIVTGLLAEIANYGVASVKRINGDWTGPNLKGWKDCLVEHSIQRVQQFAYTTGKNATDGAMIIEAMDLLYTGRFSGFCIVSSDSDFARLAARLPEQGVAVYGFGERKTPRPFVTACDFDVLSGAAPEAEAPVAAERTVRKPVAAAEAAAPIARPAPAKPSLDRTAAPTSPASARTWPNRLRTSMPVITASPACPIWSRLPAWWTWRARAITRKSSWSSSRPRPHRNERNKHGTQNH